MSRLLLVAYARGVADGWRQPFELTVGMTYDDRSASEAYDFGVNLGQRLRSPKLAQSRVEGFPLTPFGVAQ